MGQIQKHVRTVDLHDQPSEALYWRQQPPEERLAALQQIRQEYHGKAMDVGSVFREFIALLNEHDVRYLVVEGYAVAFHGHPRYTKDLDVWIDSDAENVERLLGVLKEFGFGSLGLEVDDFLEPETVVQLGHLPNRIDLVTDVDGIEFPESYASRSETNIEGTRISFLGLEQLRKNKKASGRHQDLADLENLGGEQADS